MRSSGDMELEKCMLTNQEFLDPGLHDLGVSIVQGAEGWLIACGGCTLTVDSMTREIHQCKLLANRKR